MELTQALAESCDTYFYRVGAKFYSLSSSRGPTLQLWASRFGFGATDRDRHRPRERRARADARLALQDVRGPAARHVDRIWKPGYEVQLAIGQGDLEVTPIQMARFYAMIANGGQMVTPHIAQDVEQSSGDSGAAAGAARARDAAADAERRRPGRPQAVQEGLYAEHALDLRHLVRRLRPVPGRDRRQDRDGREGRARFPAIRTRSS